jgi:hypothetical protein
MVKNDLTGGPSTTKAITERVQIVNKEKAVQNTYFGIPTLFVTRHLLIDDYFVLVMCTLECHSVPNSASKARTVTFTMPAFHTISKLSSVARVLGRVSFVFILDVFSVVEMGDISGCRSVAPHLLGMNSSARGMHSSRRVEGISDVQV